MLNRHLTESFNETDKLAVWEEGIEIIQEGKKFDKRIWRYDKCGSIMKYSDYGNTDSEYGWEIDHIIPTSKGGSDNLDNLQPLQWENNRKKGDTSPWSCK